MSQISNRPVDWETLVKENEDRLYRAALAILGDAPEPEERQELEEIFSLPPADRAVIHLFYYEGLSTGEIARLTGQAEGTVRSRLSRARSRLRRLLEGETK